MNYLYRELFNQEELIGFLVKIHEQGNHIYIFLNEFDYLRTRDRYSTIDDHFDEITERNIPKNLKYVFPDVKFGTLKETTDLPDLCGSIRSTIYSYYQQFKDWFLSEGIRRAS